MNAWPYNIKGRTYKIFLESDGSEPKITTSDIPEAAIDGDYIKLPADFITIDTKYEIHAVSGGNTQTLNVATKLYSDGTEGIGIPKPYRFDCANIYIFGHRD